MDFPLRQTKIVVPHRRSDLLTRSCLLTLLRKELQEHKLILVSAPAGYGKTSLLIDMTYHIDMPTCWFTIDQLDREPQRFLAHFFAAVNKRFSDVGRQAISAFSNQHSEPQALDLDQLVTILTNDVYEQVTEDFAIVLDDYHFVEETSSIDCFISSFVQAVTPKCHLVISSRNRTTLPELSLLMARSCVGGITLDELAFRADEIQELVLQNYHATISDDVAQELAEAAEGWITGLLLSTQEMWTGMTDRLRSARASGVGFYDYLAQQVLDQQPTNVRDFLLRSSLLDEFDAELCRAVFGPADNTAGDGWQHLIDTVIRRNLFVMPIGSDERWIRYHHLFQEFLQSRLKEEMPDEYRRILRRIAQIYVEHEAFEQAYDAYATLDDDKALADMIEVAGSTLIQNSRFALLDEWLNAMPESLYAERPRLLSLHGTVKYMLGDLYTGMTLLTRAEAMQRAEGTRHDLAQTLARRAFVHRYLAEYGDALDDANEVLELADPDDALADVRAEALRVKGFVQYQLGDTTDAFSSLEQALTLYRELGEEHKAAMVLMELGVTCCAAGRCTTSEQLLRQAYAHWQDAQNTMWQTNVLNNLGVLCHRRGQYELAAKQFERALHFAQQSREVRLEGFIRSGLGDLYVDIGATYTALKLYQQARDIALKVDDQFLRLHLSLGRARILRERGDFARASEKLNSVQDVVDTSKSSAHRADWLLARGRLALSQDHPEQAITHVDSAVSAYREGDRRVEYVRALLVLAAAQKAAGSTQAAVESLERVFTCMAGLENHHPMVLTCSDLTSYLRDWEHHDRVGEQLASLYERADAFQRRVPNIRRRLRRQLRTVSFDPPSLKVQTLGHITVCYEGKTLTRADWPILPACYLFFCLLAHPHGLSRQMATDLCWPGASMSQQETRFKNALYHLRSVLASETIVFKRNRYYFNRELDYEYDVESFLAAFDDAETTSKHEQRIEGYQRAVRIYDGPYLPDVEFTWVSTERERLFRKFVRALTALAEYNLENGAYATALDYCERALAEDMCLEAVHRLAMRAHAGLGNRAGCVRQFSLCQQAMLSELDVMPSPQTQQLYHRLIAR